MVKLSWDHLFLPSSQLYIPIAAVWLPGHRNPLQQDHTETLNEDTCTSRELEMGSSLRRISKLLLFIGYAVKL